MLRFKTYTRLKEEFVDFAQYQGAKEEVYKNPTSKEMTSLFKSVHSKLKISDYPVRCWFGNKDALLWAGFSTAHSDVKPGKYIPGRSGWSKFIEGYIVFDSSGYTLSRISLSIGEKTYCSDSASLDSLHHIALIPWVRAKIQPNTKFTVPRGSSQEVLFTGKDLR